MRVKHAISYIHPQLIESRSSKYSTQIKVYKFLGKYFVSAGGLTQSGGLVTKLWQAAIQQVQLSHLPRPNILVLGLGAGSSIAPILKKWPQAQITAVEIDPVMIELADQYFQVTNSPQLTIINQDAFTLISTLKSTYELVCIDMYIGGDIPPQAESAIFLSSIKKLLTSDGTTIINRLDTKTLKASNQRFAQLLTDTFDHVRRLKTPVNQVFAASLGQTNT